MKQPYVHTFHHPFVTESGTEIESPAVSYQAWGTLNTNRDNAVLVFHALTGNTAADEWFSGLFGAGNVLDPEQQFIICPNVLGSCYGTTGPASLNPKTRRPWGGDFPLVTIRDMAKLHQRLLDELGIRRIKLVIGGSMGGMQALEFVLMDSRAESAVLIGMGKAHNPWAIGISHTQRQAIYSDPNWNNGNFSEANPPKQGLALARMIAMNSYRHPADFETKFGRELQPGSEQYQVESYLNYQGDKLAARFHAVSYVRLTQAMDSHDVGRGRNGFSQALKQVQIPILVIGIDTDWLYPVSEQKELASLLPAGTYAEIRSPYGHDAFLIEFEQIRQHYRAFLTHKLTPEAL